MFWKRKYKGGDYILFNSPFETLDRYDPKDPQRVVGQIFDRNIGGNYRIIVFNGFQVQYNNKKLLELETEKITEKEYKQWIIKRKLNEQS